MKLIKKSISAKDGTGSVSLRPETPEDLWHAYNLLQMGDLVRCTTLRKVVKESNTGSTVSSKMRTNLTIQVSKVEFDPEGGTLRLSGPNRTENEFVRMGAFHTLTLELHRNFTVEKVCWDAMYLERIDEACHPDRGAEVAAVVMTTGLAHVCLVTNYMTVTKARIEVSIAKKRTGSSDHAKSIKRFFEAVYQAILRHVNFEVVKCVLLGSPGYTKDDFFKYLCTESVRRDDRLFIENKTKFVLCRASSGHKHALEEVFSDPAIMARLNDTKMAKEVSTLQKFMRTMDLCPEKAYYGFAHVQKANSEHAIESLMVTDELFRSNDVATRKKYVNLVESVRQNGGEVLVFSTAHVSGQQLQLVSGVAAILRFPMPDLDALEEEANREWEGDGEEEEVVHDKAKEMDRINEDMDAMGF